MSFDTMRHPYPTRFGSAERYGVLQFYKSTDYVYLQYIKVKIIFALREEIS
jgi:hypothetical protein